MSDFSTIFRENPIFTLSDDMLYVKNLAYRMIKVKLNETGR